MLALAIVVNALLTAVWRRLLGGWTWPLAWAVNTPLWGLDDKGEHRPRRSLLMAIGVLQTWPLWLVLPALPALLASAAVMVFWSLGHEMTNDRAMWLRYGPFAVGWIAARHLGVTAWTETGELTAGALVGAVIALALLFPGV